MKTQALWEFFRDTGAPEAYLLYKKQQLLEHPERTEEEQQACI